MYAFIYDNIDNLTLESMLIDNEFDSLMYESNMVDVLHEQTKNDIRFKIMTESGDMSDLAFLYEEAEKVANEKKKNIFTRIVEFIGKIVNSIISSAKTFFNSLSGEDEKEDKGTELPENIETNVEQLEQETNKITQIVNMFTGNNSKALDALKKISVPILGAAVGFAVKHGVKKYFKNKKKSLVNKLENCAKKLGENAKKAGSFVGDGAGSILGKIKDLTSSVNTSIKTIVFHKKDGDKKDVSEAKAAKIKEKAEKKRKKEFEKNMKKRRKEIEKNRKKYGSGNDYLKNPDKV
jgi:hypothetical protein